MKYLKVIFVVMLSIGFLAACTNDDEENEEMMEAQQDMEMSESAADSMNTMNQGNTIVAVASSDSSLSTLVKAIQGTGSVQMLSNEGPFTVFAPTNAAFNEIPQSKRDSLMMPENQDELRNILAFHVVQGSMMASDLQDGQTLTSEQGAELEITKQNGTVMVNGATVTQADIKASNGVIHVVDKVIMPSN